MEINEEVFWREVVFAFCAYHEIDPEEFFHRIKPIKEIWQIRKKNYVYEKIKQMERNKSEFLVQEVKNIMQHI